MMQSQHGRFIFLNSLANDCLNTLTNGFRHQQAQAKESQNRPLIYQLILLGKSFQVDSTIGVCFTITTTKNLSHE